MPRSSSVSGVAVWVIGTAVALAGLATIVFAPGPVEVILVQSLPVEPVTVWTVGQVVGGGVLVVGLLVAAVGLGRVAARRRALPADAALAGALLISGALSTVGFWARTLGSGTQVPTYGPVEWNTAITAWGPVTAAGTLVMVAAWMVIAAVSTAMLTGPSRSRVR